MDKLNSFLNNIDISNNGASGNEYTNVDKTEFVSMPNPYLANGVQMQKTPDQYRLVYNGILSKNGTNEIYAVISEGDNTNWQNVQSYPMHMAGQQKYEVYLQLPDTANIHIAFTDGAGNWDNNSGKNYTFEFPNR